MRSVRRTSNPALSEKRWRSVRGVVVGNEMTISGTVTKSLILVALVFAGAVWAWSQAYPSGWGQGVVPQASGWLIPAFIGSLGFSLVMLFKPNTSPYLAPLYALAEGVLLGSISVMFDHKYPGIAFQAVISTFGTFVAMLLSYQSGLIKVTDKFRMGVVAATGGIAIVYILDIVLNLFGLNVPFIHSAGPLGIAVSVFIVVVAALNLLLDFDAIQQNAMARAPKYMEWFCGFALLLTLVWLYLEILNLLAKSQQR